MGLRKYWALSRGKIYFRVWRFGDEYMAMATDGEHTVVNCYGSTSELAKEIALFRLRKCESPDAV